MAEQSMVYKSLGRSGLKVSRLCMGTTTFGNQAGEVESVRMVNCAVDAGINFFDTADIYSDGLCEEILGKALAGKRDKVVVATKCGYAMGSGPNEKGLSRRHILKAAEESLRRLRTDYIDVYLLHQPDYTTPLEESLRAMDQLVKDGKVRYVGMSNYAAWQVCQAQWICDRRDLAPIVCVQLMYNLLARGVEQELLPFCREMGVGIMAYNPLAGGLLTGKHRKGQPPVKGTRFDLQKIYRDRYWHDSFFGAVEALKIIAADAGLSLIELSLRWVLAQHDVTCVNLGASSLDQLENNLKACQGALSDSVVETCNKVWGDLQGPIPWYNR